MPRTQDILISVDGPVGRVHLNHPKALNSLTQDMCADLLDALTAWKTDPAVQAVVVTAEGDRAFCAGGNVRDVSAAGRKDPVAARVFFQIEYAMDVAIAEFPKPYLCLIDGIVMGGGLGISVNGRYRVMGDNVMAAMPETGIGLLPDVGATAFLNACPGRVGLYLGLTGARLDTADALFAKFGTHHVASDKHAALLQALIAADYSSDAFAAVDRMLAEFSSPAGPSKLEAQRADIDRLFAADDMETIVETLKADESKFAAEALAAFDHMSPTSLKITARQITQNPGISVRDSLILEYRLVAQVLLRHEFYEGIRAALVDKDRNPQWKPATLAEVTPQYIDEHFASLGEQELVLD